MNGLEKCAVLLLSVGEHAAAQVMKHLDESAVSDLSFAMSRMESLDRNITDTVVQEYLAQLETQPVHGIDSLEFVRDALVEAVGERKAGRVMEYIMRGDSMTSTMDIVRRTDASMLSEQMRGERPQVVALLLAHLESSAAADLLSRLRPELAQEALYRYAGLNSVRPRALSELAGMLSEQLSSHVGLSRLSDVGGPRRAADILNNLPASDGKLMLDAIAGHDSKLSDTIRESMFVFADLVAVEPRALQILLRSIPEDQLVHALKATTPEVTEILMANLSTHVREAVQEDLSYGRHVRRSDAESAQKEILKTARRLDEEGKITLMQSEELL